MQQHEFLIGTVRFNNKTYIENLKWKQRKGYNGCAYGLDKPLSNKIPSGKWRDHIKNDNNMFVNISSIAFLMTGKILKQDELKETDIIMSLLKNISKPVLRTVIKKSINILAKQFIFEKDIKRASKLSSKLEGSIYAYSFDMLGEGARTYNDANKYFENYKNAITAIGKSSTKKKHSISIK